MEKSADSDQNSQLSGFSKTGANYLHNLNNLRVLKQENLHFSAF